MSPTIDPRANDRVLAIDALRGLAVLVWLLSITTSPSLDQFRRTRFIEALATQLSSSFWHGLTAFDLAQPIFLFVAGAAIGPAFARRRAAGQSNPQLAGRIARRVLVLCAIGLLCEGGLVQHWPYARLAGSFQRIAFCYAAVSLIDLTTGLWFQVGALFFLLLNYTAILALGAPGGPSSAYSLEANAAAVVDQLLLPGRKYFGTWDPQGILTTIPAIAVTIAGLLASKVLTKAPNAAVTRDLWLFGVGIVAIDAGFLASNLVPINPHLWTPSFCLSAIGAGSMLLGAFHAVLDVCRWTAWASVVTALGRNSLVAVVTTAALLTIAESCFAAPSEPLAPKCIVEAIIVPFIVGTVALCLNRRRIYVTV
jgi:predicted acyltransferase